MNDKNKNNYIKFTDDDGTFIQCKKCLSEYVKVSDESIVAVTCAKGVTVLTWPTEQLNKMKGKKKTSGRPAGWHWMAEFVDKKGNVFHKGKEQPDLKGTLPPTKIVIKKKKRKSKSKVKTDSLFAQAALHKKKLKIKRKAK